MLIHSPWASLQPYPTSSLPELLEHAAHRFEGKVCLINLDGTEYTITQDGWLRTGDIGQFDDEGYVYIVDRKKELIKYKGYQVPPAELEALLMEHPAVADAAVIPKPDQEGGEIPKAFVALKPSEEATEEAILQFVADRVAPYKKVRELEFVDTIPKSLSGKILRRELVEQERAKSAG